MRTGPAAVKEIIHQPHHHQPLALLIRVVFCPEVACVSVTGGSTHAPMNHRPCFDRKAVTCWGPPEHTNTPEENNRHVVPKVVMGVGVCVCVCHSVCVCVYMCVCVCHSMCVCVCV